MDPTARQDLLSSFLYAGQVQNKDRYLRFERMVEVFTWIAIILGLLVIQLPFSADLDKRSIYILSGSVAVYAILWHRVLPKRFSGLTKNFIYSVFAIGFLAFIVNRTGGVQSYSLFLYYLSAVPVAITMPLLHASIIAAYIATLIFIEAIFFSPGSLTTNLSLSALHAWALFLTIFYSRAEAGEAALAKKREEEVLLEKEKTLSKLKDDFLFIISHELKQPSETIKGYIESIIRESGDSLTPDAKKILEMTNLNSKRLSKLLDDLLDISQIEQGSMKIQISDVALRPVISEVLSNLFFEAKNKKIALDQMGDVDTAAKADPDRLKEILTNLIGNAIKYSPEGTKVIVEVKKEKDFARINVIDNGFGISEEDQKNLFGKFYRVQSDKTKNIKGNGLGLFITKQLVENMGGQIGVTSQAGKGSTFSFTLPRYHW